TALCAHIPGLKVVFPATPYDAKGLMHAALTGTDPVVFFESQRLYDQPELYEVEDSFFPFPSDILDTIHTHLEPLPGYVVQRPCDTAELLRRSREGV
ncbi:MAG TPA: hypothetical protein VFB21_19580, partial [Chthonomonadaceae bacterium]|nr:hypothetical protein [Chthonomonadaceae bacterium]